MAPDYIERILTLADHTAIVIRAADSADAPRLLHMHQRLSPETKYHRYLDLNRRLEMSEARFLCTADGLTRMLMVAAPEADPTRIIGYGYYAIPNFAHPNEAEVTVVIEDAWQGRGVGTLLTRHLAAYAALHGIDQFSIRIDYRNAHVLRMLEALGLPHTVTAQQDGIYEISITVPSAAQIARIHLERSPS